MNTKAREVAKEVLLIVCSNSDKAPAVVAERVSKAISKHFPEPNMSVKELEQQRDAALKLADRWKTYASNARRSIDSRFALSGYADQLRAIFAPKDGK